MIVTMGNIAVFLAGWNSEIQTRMITGIIKRAEEEQYTISVFTCQAGAEISEMHVEGENKIYSLANLDRFDGIILAAQTIWVKSVRDDLIKRLLESGKPVISMEENVEGMGFVGIDNYRAMESLLLQIEEEGDYHHLHFIGGPKTQVESRQRRQAFLDCVERRRLDKEKCKVWTGDFSFEKGAQIAGQILEEGQIPEVIVCANDTMALGVCAKLKESGYRVPEDIRVTGFDGNYDTREAVTSITTVNRPKEELGYTACEELIEMIEQHSVRKMTMATAVFEPKRSEYKEETIADLEGYVESLYLEKQLNAQYNRGIRDMDDEMMECETLQELVFCVRQNLDKLTSEEAYLCLNESVYYEMTGSSVSRYRYKNVVKEYEEMVYMTKISKEDGMPIFESFESERMIPVMWDKKCNNETFIYFPVHFRDNCLGYLVLKGRIETDRVTYHSMWIRNISNALEKLKNILLVKSALCNIDNLAVKDSLTGVYNRTGINRFVVDMVKRVNQKQGEMLFVFADVDHLKLINDTYGHEAGDQAICLSADALREVFGEDELIIRYGGDEFLIVTERINEHEIAQKCREIEMLLTKWAKEEHLQYRLTVSIGSFQKNVQTEATMEQYIDWADECMYQNKCENRKNRKNSVAEV